jgi:putrescine aminotransferase
MSEIVASSQVPTMEQEEVLRLWAEHISKGQTTLIGAFGFGNDRAHSAQGAWITLSNGRRILDFTGGIGVLNHGHNHPKILNARIDYQRRNRMEVHKNFFSPYAAALAKNWSELMPDDLEVSYFPNSGAEAVEGAVKLAYKYHGGRRGTILRSNIAFHGKLLGAGGLTASPELNFSFPTIPGIDEFIFGDLESVKQAIARHDNQDGSSDVYAIIIEPFSATTLRSCSEGFLRGLMQLCRSLDIILIFDEVYTGWGKTGSLFYFMRYEGLVPDIVTTSKSFGGGKSSISGFISRRKIFVGAYGTSADATLHSTTYFGCGEEGATALAAMEVTVDERFAERALDLGAALQKGFERLCVTYPNFFTEHRGAGALRGIRVAPVGEAFFKMLAVLPGPWHADVQFAQKLAVGAVISRLYDEHGILTYFASNEPILLIASPPLICELSDVDTFLVALEECAQYGLPRMVADFCLQAVKR